MKKRKHKKITFDPGYRVIFRLFSEDKMASFPEAVAGDMVECFFCGKDHPLISATCVKSRKKDTMFLIYKCHGRWEIGAIFGRLIAGRIPDKQVDDECPSS